MIIKVINETTHYDCDECGWHGQLESENSAPAEKAMNTAHDKFHKEIIKVLIEFPEMNKYKFNITEWNKNLKRLRKERDGK